MSSEMPTDPWTTFQQWLAEAKQSNLRDPGAFILSTVDTAGQPSSRVLLCKEVRPDGFVFYTNYESTKGKQMASHPGCAVTFFWDPLHKQVNMQGSVKQLTGRESDHYWKSRARDSQLTQYVSRQSSQLNSRHEMEEEMVKLDQEFQGREIPRPLHWGGYLFIPNSIELWIGQKGRFHDRFRYTKVQNTWTSQRLYP